MDKLSLISIISVSFPENFCLLITAIAIAGCHNYLIVKNKRDIFKIFIAASFMSLSNVFTRQIAINIIDVLFMNTIINFAIMWLFIKIEWYKAALGIIVSTLFIMAIELFYMPIAMTITNITANEIYSSNTLRVLFSAPERLVQLAVALYCVKKRIIIINLSRIDRMGKLNKLKLGLITLVMVCTMILVSIYAKVFMYNNSLFQDFKLIMLSTVGFGLVLLVVVSLIIGLYKVGKQALEEQEKLYITKVDYNQVLFNIHEHLRKGNVERAKQIIRKNVFLEGEITIDIEINKQDKDII